MMGATGLFLSLFVLAHVSGNFLIFLGAKAYNTYGHFLIENPLFEVVEVVLLLCFLLHVFLAVSLTIRNKKARPEKYAVTASGYKKTAFFEKTLWHQGTILLVFVALHLRTFKYGHYYEATYDSVVMRDLFRLVVEVFQSPSYVVFYTLCLVILFFHLFHGVRSSLSTLGLHHSSYEKKVKALSFAVAFFVALGFISQPIYVFFAH